MIRYTAGRVAQAVIVVILSSAVVFSLVRAMPGNPAELLDGPQATPRELAATARYLGLDKPIVLQYVLWMGHLLRGQLGVSLTTHQPVSTLIVQAFVPTLWLLIGAMLVALVVGLGLGILSAGVRVRGVEVAVAALTSLLYGAPAVWIGLVAIFIFAVQLHLLPPEGFVNPLLHPIAGLKALALPSSVLGLGIGGIEARFVRGSLGEALAQDYALVARAKGCRRSRVLMVHAGKNGLIPVITTYGLNFAYLLGGAVVIETVFTWPGIGNLLENSITSSDYATVQALVMVFVVTFAVVNLATDLLYGAVDPRIRHGMSGSRAGQ